MKKQRWQFNWKITTFVVVFFPLCVGLGIWQLQRADEKRAIEYAAQAAQQLPAQNIESPDFAQGNLAFRKVLLTGQFDNTHIFLLDNQLRQGKPGYDVLVPFQTKLGNVYLINRGWIAVGATRQTLPVIAPIEGQQTIEGYIYIPAGEPITLREDKPSGQWPQLISKIDTRLIGGLLQKTIFPYTIRLLQDRDDGLVRQWPTVNMPPAKHLAYAIQWFGLALALIILFFWSARKFAQEAAEHQHE